MQSSLVQVGSARKAISNHLPCRVRFDTDLGQQSERSRNHEPQELRPADRRIALAIQHMVQHLNEPLRISTLCAVTGLSPSHFFSLFKSATGFSPIAFFISLRIQQACDRLQDPQLTIKETAYRAGYNDEFYFTRVFKQVIGVSPSEYRRTLAARAPEGALSNKRTEVRRLPSLAFAFSLISDLEIVNEAEPGDVPGSFKQPENHRATAQRETR